ncbi:MAG: GFA family protein [Alphaproteobacteria bacterium]|nr:MAG: GFA family protein [Alphaproteobacteria bacterium]
MAEPVFTGGCQCGAVRYSWGAALVSVPGAQLAWTCGRPAEFRSSAIVARGFCASCGTPLHMKEDGDPIFEIAIGTLDNPELAPPTEQAGVEAELSWFKSMPDLPRQRTQDYRTLEDLAKLRSLQHPDHDTRDWPPSKSSP